MEAERAAAVAEPGRQSGVDNHSVHRLPKMLSVRTVQRALGRGRKWVFRMCQASKETGSPWPGTCMVGNAWRVPEQALVAWWAKASGISPEEARAMLVQAGP